MNDWHARTQRTQHLARELARRGFLILYVNPHLGREFPDISRQAQSERLLQLEPNLLELHIHLPREPVFHHRCLTKAESDTVARAITNALAQAGAGPAVQLLSLPIWLEAALAVRHALSAPLVYDCHDYLAGFTNVAPEIVAQEAAVFRASDLVVCTSDALLQHTAQQTHAPRALLRNAADPAFFAGEVHAPPAQITIGYAGALESWFDTEAVRHAAESRPDWRFELIGRVENQAVATLSDLPNIHLAGEVPFAELPGRLARFTVGLIPFKLNPLIEATDPIKAYEYLACGLPVVASAMPELRRFGSLIYTYTSPANLVTQLDRATSEPLPEAAAESAKARRAAVQSETWPARAAEFEQLLAQINMC